MLIKLKVGVTFCLGHCLAFCEEGEFILNKQRFVWFAKYASKTHLGCFTECGSVGPCSVSPDHRGELQFWSRCYSAFVGSCYTFISSSHHISIFSLSSLFHRICFFTTYWTESQKAAWPSERTPVLIAANGTTQAQPELCICFTALVRKLQQISLLDNNLLSVASINPWHRLTQFLITRFPLDMREIFFSYMSPLELVRS